MGRITLESSSGSAVGAGSESFTPEMPARLSVTEGQTKLHSGLDSLFELLDRVAGQSPRPPSAVAPAAAEAAKKTDPTDLPSTADCAKSLRAIAAAGFTDVHLKPVPYLNQGIGDWAHHPYPRNPPVPGEARTISQAGCAPTALAMLDCGLRDAHTRPEAVADFAVRNQVSGNARTDGTNTAGLARDWAGQNGLSLTAGTSAHQSRNVDILKAGLLADGIALVSVGADHAGGPGHFSNGGHVMVVNGCAVRGGEEWFAIANPGRAHQAAPRPHEALLTTDNDVMQIGRAHNGVGQVWISRKQLEAEMKYCFVFRSGAES